MSKMMKYSNLSFVNYRLMNHHYSALRSRRVVGHRFGLKCCASSFVLSFYDLKREASHDRGAL